MLARILFSNSIPCLGPWSRMLVHPPIFQTLPSPSTRAFPSERSSRFSHFQVPVIIIPQSTSGNSEARASQILQPTDSSTTHSSFQTPTTLCRSPSDPHQKSSISLLPCPPLYLEPHVLVIRSLPLSLPRFRSNLTSMTIHPFPSSFGVPRLPPLASCVAAKSFLIHKDHQTIHSCHKLKAKWQNVKREPYYLSVVVRSYAQRTPNSRVP